MKVKVAISTSYGGFGLSQEAYQLYQELCGHAVKFPTYGNREDPHLITVIETLGAKANSSFSELQIVELEKGTKYMITESHGSEDIVTIDEVDWIVAGS